MEKLEIQSQNLEITQAIANYLKKKIHRACKNAENHVSSVKVNLSYEHKVSHVVEILIFQKNGKVLRGEAFTDDMYASIDLACANIERQMRRLKEKVVDIRRNKSKEYKDIYPEEVMGIAI